MNKIFVILAVSVLMINAATSNSIMAGSGNSGDRFVMVTYWGEDEVALIDLQGRTGAEEVWKLNVYEQDGCAKPYDIKISAKGDYAYTTCSGGEEIAVIDIIAQLVSHKIKTGSSPRDIALSKDGKFAVTANSGENTISVIDLIKKEVTKKIPVSNQPYGVALANNDSVGIITGWASGEVHFVSLNDEQGVMHSLDVGALPYTVVIDDSSQIAYVSVNADHKVVAIDVEEGQLIGNIEVGRNPWGLAISTDGKGLVVANNRSNDISYIYSEDKSKNPFGQQKRYKLDRPVRAGQETARAPKNSHLSASGLEAVITDLANNEILLVELATGRILKVIKVGRAPYGIDYLQ